MKRLPVALAVLAAAAGLPTLAAATEHLVTQKGQQFSPQMLKVKVGDEIVFQNDDVGTHNVFSESAANKFDLKAQRPGASTRVSFAAPGRVDVRCAIHPAMRMTVEVE